MDWWVTSYWHVSHMLLISWVFWVICSIVLHELAHGVAAIRLGDDTPYHTGHMTWNPMVHMGSQALLMFALFGFTWGAMPISPHRLRGRYGESIVAAAGPLCNAAQFLVLMVIDMLWIKLAYKHVDDNVFQNLHTFLWMGCVINLMGVSLNLIPAPPLDGWRILCDVSVWYRNLWRGENAAVVGMIAFAIIFLGAGRILWPFVFHTTDDIVIWGVGVLGGSYVPPPY